MEISSNRLQPYSPAQQQPGRADGATPFKQPPQEGQEKRDTSGELLRTPQQAQQANEAQLDYRQLVLQARLQQVEVKHQESSGGEAYRMGVEPMKVQQALGAYRDNAELQETDAELMPRLDDYV